MNRRTAIRNAIIISAGAGLLPSCMHEDKAVSIPLKNIALKGSQEDMLAELAETIIPGTSTFIGAKDLKAHEFILTMVDDCMSPEDQKIFTTGLTLFDDACRKKLNSSFIKCSAKERGKWLKSAEKKQDMPEEALKFYGAVKHLTVQSFTTSKDYMLGIRKYKMAPGPVFKGCVPVDKV